MLPNRNTRFSLILFLICFPLVAGCTSGGFKKTEYFAEYPETACGMPNYYRISIEGSGWNGKVDYRSGWYNAQAVDSLFGSLGDEQRVRAMNATRQGKAVRNTFNTYMGALESGAEDDVVAKAKSAYQEAVQSVSGVTNAGSSRTSLLDRAHEKFVMILSNDPSKVIEAIKGRVQQMEIAKTLGAALRQSQARSDAINRDRLGILVDQIDSLVARFKAYKPDQSSAPERLQAEIRNLLTELEGF